MPILIDRLPFGSAPQGATLPVPLGNPIPLLPDCIVLWASVSPLGIDELKPTSPRFPVVFDSGFNNGFLMQKLQMMSWTAAGTYEHCFRSGMFLHVAGEAIPMYYASVWLHPNVPGKREPQPAGRPYCLESPMGIAVTPAGSENSKSMPLLGLAAIRFNDMRVHIDGKRETVTIEVP